MEIKAKMNISKAKQLFVHYYGDEDGFVGVGVGNETGKPVLRVYVDKEDSALAKRLRIQRSFDGYPLEIVVMGTMKAGG